MKENKPQTFNDGSVKIYEVINTAPPGKKPIKEVIYKNTLRYHERTVGLNRYYKALQLNAKIKYVLRCPCLRSVSTQDVAIPNDGKQYHIKQIQYPEDIKPRVMDLTLERVTADYDIK